MGGATVRRLQRRDVERAIELTDLEQWGYAPADVERLLALSPAGCFAAEADGRVVGVMATTSYGKVAYLGSVVVDPGHRGHGIGNAMMRAALDHLDGSGVETVRLNAYTDVVPFYEALGFSREYDNIRWEGGRAVGATARARFAAWEDLDALVAFDEVHFGGSRGVLLERLLSEFPGTFLVAEDRDTILGYLVGNTVSQACEIGPWVVEPGNERVAADLFFGLMAVSNRPTYAFSAPAVHPEPHALARAVRYREGFRSIRMVRGPARHGGNPGAIWSFGGLEKG